MTGFAIVKNLTLTVIFVLVLAVPTSARAQAVTNTTNVQVPLNFPQFVPCANGGAGDIVILTGTVHILAHVTVDAQAGIHVHTVTNFQDVSAVGQVTGLNYRGVGVLHTDMINNNGPTQQLEGTQESTFQVVGQGPGNNLKFKALFHQTVNSNGEFTADVVNVSADCS